MVHQLETKLYFIAVCFQKNSKSPSNYFYSINMKGELNVLGNFKDKHLSIKLGGSGRILMAVGQHNWYRKFSYYYKVNENKWNTLPSPPG